MTSEAEPGGSPLEGTTLSHYRLAERLGAGGMGVVYRAHDTNLHRDVAIKLLPADLVADEQAQDRLLREARTASRLNHPHICVIHEVGQADGQIYIAMELVEGRPLNALIPEGGMAAETVARYGAQIARALAHAHEHHVVHRDLKTANVAVTVSGQTKLLDFGLSRRVLEEGASERGHEPASAKSTPVTITGTLSGTPQYMAPEVLMGGPADARSDIWALGVVLYEMCCGRVPFGVGGMPGVVAAILHSAPEALPDRVPAGLRSVVMRCLAKDPEQRYPRAGEVAAALEALLPETGPAASGVRRRLGLTNWPRRRTLTLLAVATVVVVATIVAWRLWGPGRGSGVSQANTVLILPLEVRGQVRDADFAGQAFAEALAVDLAQSRGVHVMPVPSSGDVPGSEMIGNARAAVLAGAGRLVVGALTREGDSLRARVSLIDAESNRVLWGEERVASGGDLSLLASSFSSQIRDRLGVPPPKRYDYFMYVTGPAELADSPEMAEALGAVRRYELPRSLESTRRLVDRFPREPDARVLRIAALMIDARTGSPDPSRVGAVVTELGALHGIDPGNPWHDVARAMLLQRDRQAIELLNRVLARNDLTPAARGAVLAIRADARGRVMGDTAAALADAEQAVRLDPASDLSLSTLASWLSNQGRFAEAAERVHQAVALNPTVANYWLQLGNCMLKQGQWEAYVADLERAARLSPHEDAVFSAQSDGLSCVGRHRDAAQCARRASRLKPENATYALQLAVSLMRLGEWTEAARLLDRAGRDGPPAGRSIQAAASAVALLRAGDAAAAEAQANRAASSIETKSGDYALACFHTLRGEREDALRLLERIQEQGWVEPALDRDPNFNVLRSDARFQRVAAWMRAQPVARIFAGWGQSR